MKKKYAITNLDCAHCAAKLEDAINKVKTIQSCSINFATSTMIVEFPGTEAEALKEIKKVISKVEPEVQIKDLAEKQTQSPFTFIKLIPFLLFGIGVILAFVLWRVEFPTTTFWILFICAALLIGYKTYYKAFTQLIKANINENLLVTISVIGATAIGEHIEALMVISLYTLGKILESYAVNKSRKNVKDLMQMQPEYAILLSGDKEEKVAPDNVKIGETIVVRPGERVPLDGVVIRGVGNIDVKNLTGESIPQTMKEGDEILSGSIIIDGLLYIRTTGTYQNSTVVRIMSLIEEASDKKSKAETFISKFARYYTLFVVLAASIVFVTTLLVLHNSSVALYRGLIFLVIACPCAFAISVPLAYFSGLGNASRYGILVKGSNYLDVILRTNTFVFDKTGTLTTGMFGVDQILTYSDKYTTEDILFFACLGEQHSIHPIARAIMHAGEKLKLKQVNDFSEVSGKGVYFEYNGKSYFVGKSNNDLSSTAVEIFENDEKLGAIILSDKIKEESFSTIEYLQKSNKQVVLLSGDGTETTTNVANKLKIQEFHANMLPTQKYEWLQQQISQEDNKTKTAFIGDGINDAPSLSLADVGISMGLAGSPATIEASDIVIVDDNPQKIEKCIKIAKFNRKIVNMNIIFASVFKVAFLALGALGITGMAAAVFADVGVTLLATLNSLRSLYYKP